jgi:predicted HicB family RNase H-like nuclease
MVRLGASYLYLDSRAAMQSRNFSSRNPGLGGNPQERLGYSSRKPQRITITVSHSVHEALVEESLSQGRSLSNLASFWLEQQAEAARGLRSNRKQSPSR